MKNEAQVRQVLMQNTLYLIADGGFEAATTRAITHAGVVSADVKMNESYIYRLFGSKENLYCEVFASLDREVTGVIASFIESTDVANCLPQEIFFGLAARLWELMIKTEAKLRCYMRFYYSVYFREEALLQHRLAFKRVFAYLAPYFKPEADVRAILHSAFTTMLDFAVRVHNGDLENSEDNVKHIFRMIYSSIIPYLAEAPTPAQ